MNRLILLAVFLAATLNGFAQTEQELLEKYWVFKDRYLKHFTLVGRERGYSTPINKITKDSQIVYDGTTGQRKGYEGKIEFGDAMVDQGLYMAALATEYRVLKDNNQDVTAILNELYYAIETINRLDGFAERYFGAVDLDTNGFFIRTDAPEGLYRRWEQLGDKVYYQKSDCGSGRFSFDTTTYLHSGTGKRMLKDEFGDFIEEDWKSEIIMEPYGQTYATGKGYGRRVNEQSQDHTFGLMFGLAFVHKYVDNVYVRPITPEPGNIPDRGFYIIDEVKSITERIVDQLAARKTEAFGQTDEGLEGFSPKGENVEKVSADWMAVNPTNNTVVNRGPLATQLGFTYPAREAAARILGYGKLGWDVDADIDVWYDGPITTYTDIPSLPAAIGTPCPPSGAPICPPYYRFGNLQYQFLVKPQQATFWTVFGNASLLQFYNKNHIMRLCVISGVADADDFFDFVDNHGKKTLRNIGCCV